MPSSIADLESAQLNGLNQNVNIAASGVTLATRNEASVSTVGTTALKIISAASTNAAVVKASAGRLYGIFLYNTTAAWKFVKLYNKATAPVVGTDVPVLIIGVPPNGATELTHPVPVAFGTGIGIGITGASPDADVTATAVGDVVGHLQYI